MDKAELSHIGGHSKPGLIESIGTEFCMVLNHTIYGPESKGLRPQILGLVSWLSYIMEILESSSMQSSGSLCGTAERAGEIGARVKLSDRLASQGLQLRLSGNVRRGF